MWTLSVDSTEVNICSIYWLSEKCYSSQSAWEREIKIQYWSKTHGFDSQWWFNVEICEVYAVRRQESWDLKHRIYYIWSSAFWARDLVSPRALTPQNSACGTVLNGKKASHIATRRAIWLCFWFMVKYGKVLIYIIDIHWNKPCQTYYLKSIKSLCVLVLKAI